MEKKMPVNQKNINVALKNYFHEIQVGMNKIRFTLGNDPVDRLSPEDGLSAILDWLIECRSRGNKLMFIGNGGSAAICSHMAIDFMNAGKVRAIDFNSGSLITCLANDYGFENFFAKAIEIHGRQNDIIFAISSSGRSQDILHGVIMGKKLGCRIVTLSGFNENNPLSLMGDVNIHVPISKYGEVEVAHTLILQFLVDFIKETPLN